MLGGGDYGVGQVLGGSDVKFWCTRLKQFIIRQFIPYVFDFSRGFGWQHVFFCISLSRLTDKAKPKVQHPSESCIYSCPDIICSRTRPKVADLKKMAAEATWRIRGCEWLVLLL